MPAPVALNAPNAPSFHRIKTKGTISRPSQNENIISVCKVINRHILQTGEAKRQCPAACAWNIDNFVRPQYQVRIPHASHLHSFTMYDQTLKRNRVPKPDVNNVYMFVKRVFDRAHLNPECAIIALIYTERLMEMNDFQLNLRNWIPIVLTALLTASKVWDDLCSWNCEFAEIYPVFPTKVMNRLERQFLGALDWNLYIPGSLYAKYYFGLRALRAAQARNIPKYYLQLNVGQGQAPPVGHVPAPKQKRRSPRKKAQDPSQENAAVLIKQHSAPVVDPNIMSI